MDTPRLSAPNTPLRSETSALDTQEWLKTALIPATDKLAVSWMKVEEKQLALTDQIRKSLLSSDDAMRFGLERIQQLNENLSMLLDDSTDAMQEVMQQLRRIPERKSEVSAFDEYFATTASVADSDWDRESTLTSLTNATTPSEMLPSEPMDDASIHQLLVTNSRRLLDEQQTPRGDAPSTPAFSPSVTPRGTHSRKRKHERTTKKRRTLLENQRLAAYTALQVLERRRPSGQRTQEYLIKWDGGIEPTWHTLSRCPEHAKELVLAFIRLQQSKRMRSVQHEVKQEDGTHEGDLYTVDTIVDDRIRVGKKEYYVRWDGYDSSENTWEPAEKLRREVASVVDEYERKLARNARRRHQRATMRSNESKVHQARGSMATPY
ncbi:hypothetical protein Poli38472_010833 [Pythium oligandrum]|uniref:Chromo domain-containing protein n=1 Tax=Pythium oligandrum TaxID=41045 RepID=A0A8K1FFK9_PYTOL|nr:hypothetical protein Poli38472_010833 [Pythium oligandrum]|eukprot:TMW61770.1 hypothetical protein Poli38472_010833 [Pythium oligandrum]